VSEASTTQTQRRARGPTKPYPPDKFEDCLKLAKAIHEYGFQDSIRRVTVFQRLGRPVEGRASRDLVTNSSKYGLITGNYQSENLSLTDPGKSVVEEQRNRQAEFDLAIDRIAPFKALYERLRDRRIPALDVLESQVTGVVPEYRRECATIFLSNARYIGLVYAYQGADHIRTIEHAIEELGREPAQETPATPPPESERLRASSSDAFRPEIPARPTIHLDVNIHIDANSSPEVIEQVFASMARHLYRD